MITLSAFPLKCSLPILLTVVTHDVAKMVPALEFPAALVFALPHRVGASELGERFLSHMAIFFNTVNYSILALHLVTATLAELHADFFTWWALARMARLRTRMLTAIE